MYVHIKSEPGLWTVGHYDPSGKWHHESDHPLESEATQRVSILNGGHTPRSPIDGTKQPAPTPNDLPAVWDLVLADITARDKRGEQKYKTRLQPFNGRDYLVDAYEEALDLVVYLRGCIYERDAPKE